MVKMAIYTQKCEQKWLKINNSGWGGVGGWNKDVLGGKKSKNLQSGGGGTIIRDSRVCHKFIIIRNSK